MNSPPMGQLHGSKKIYAKEVNGETRNLALGGEWLLTSE